MISKIATLRLAILSTQDLCDILGISCFDIPQNKAVTAQDVVDINMKDGTNRSLQSIIPVEIEDEAKRQRKMALVSIVLEAEGLCFNTNNDTYGYRKFSRGKHSPPPKEYAEKVRSIVLRNAKNLDSIFVDHEADCARREFELSSMTTDEIGDLLGLKVDTIPLNEKIDKEMAIKQRQALAIRYIMHREGLELSESGENYVYVQTADIDNAFSNYSEMFIRYVNANSIEIRSQQRENRLNKMSLDDLSHIADISIEEIMYRTYVYNMFNTNFDSAKIKPYVIRYVLENEGLRYSLQSENSLKVDPSKYDIFKQCAISYKREGSLSKMNSSDFDNELGCRLDEVLLQHYKGFLINESQKKSFAIKYIMEKEGLKLATYGDNARAINKMVDVVYPEFCKIIRMLTYDNQT